MRLKIKYCIICLICAIVLVFTSEATILNGYVFAESNNS